MTGLPQGWATITIGEASGVGGLSTDGDWIESKDQDPTGSVRLIQLQDIGDGTFVNKSSRFLTEEKAEELNCTYLSPGDVLIARMPDPLGRACRFPDIGQKSVTAVDVHVWRKGEHGVEPDFLVYCVNSPEIRQSLQAQASGTTRQRVSGGRLKAQEIPLPPLAEQRRIVRKLDTLSARSTTARTHLTAIEKLVERYKLAVLRSAFFVDASGTLNEEEAAACGWDVRPLGQSLENLDNRRIPIKAEDRKKRQGPYDYYGASGVIDKIDEYLFDGRYLLIGEDGANLVARSSPIAFIAEGKFWVNNHAHVLGETHDACLDWVRLYFAAIKLEPFVTGSAQPKLTQANLNKIPIPLPTPDEQREIVRRIETAFAKIDRLKAEAAKALKLLGHFDQRILAKAFAGDLVPQDPNDEPAETLLTRIREARAAAPKGRRGTKATA